MKIIFKISDNIVQCGESQIKDEEGGVGEAK
jgi:hypothetical protein